MVCLKFIGNQLGIMGLIEIGFVPESNGKCTQVWFVFFGNSRNEDIKVKHLLGANGVTLSALRPYGKAEIQNTTYEVKTLGNYLPSGVNIKVIHVDEDHKIIVEQLNR